MTSPDYKSGRNKYNIITMNDKGNQRYEACIKDGSTWVVFNHIDSALMLQPLHDDVK